MTIKAVSGRVERGNKMLQALKKETPRGQACVADAFLDEILRTVFENKLIKSKQTKELLSYMQPLGSHGSRLKTAYALGWVGPLTYKYVDLIHKIRNRMAHELDVEEFDHPQVRDLVNNIDIKELLPPSMSKARFPILGDIFMIAAQYSLMQLWVIVDDSTQLHFGLDRPLIHLDTPK
jgi:DNA-binding MltR family transcriptional regulator